MKSNSLGRYFGLTCFGESHGYAMGMVIEDVLPNVEFPYSWLESALQRRRPGNTPYSSQRNEPDDYQVISGVFEGKTTGMPICILFKNIDHKSADYEELKDIFRPGHADYSWYQKFKIYDYRGGGRASGRETICRVAAGAIVKDRLKDIQISVYPIKIGEHNISQTNQVESYLQSVKDEKDSVGAIVEVMIDNVLAGLGDPVFEKLDANLAKSILSIPGVKGIEFGDGYLLAELKGSEGNDTQVSNHQGGIIGGVSNGKSIIFRIAVRAPSSIGKKQIASAIDGTERDIAITGRHDICLVPRILPVIESMVQLVLADAIAHQELISETKKDLSAYREAIDKIDEDILIALYRRNEIARLIGIYKQEHNLPIKDQSREDALIQNLIDIAKEWGLSTDLVTKVWESILVESKKIQ